MTQNATPNFQTVSTAQLWAIVKRGKYVRWDANLIKAIDAELAARRLAERRAN